MPDSPAPLTSAAAALSLAQRWGWRQVGSALYLLGGVLAAALDRGAALPDAMRRACAAAALACTRTGAQAALPDAAETDALLASPSPSGVKP